MDNSKPTAFFSIGCAFLFCAWIAAFVIRVVAEGGPFEDGAIWGATCFVALFSVASSIFLLAARVFSYRGFIANFLIFIGTFVIGFFMVDIARSSGKSYNDPVARSVRNQDIYITNKAHDEAYVENKIKEADSYMEIWKLTPPGKKRDDLFEAANRCLDEANEYAQKAMKRRQKDLDRIDSYK